MPGLALLVQEGLKRDPHAGDLHVFRGRSGSLIKILWHDGVGMSLYMKRLEKGRFLWPTPTDGAVAISAAQLAYLLEGDRLAQSAPYLAACRRRMIIRREVPRFLSKPLSWRAKLGHGRCPV